MAYLMGTQQLPMAEKISDEPVPNRTPQSTVTCVFSIYIAGSWRNVTILWSKNLMNHSLSLMFNNIKGEIYYSLKIDLKPWLFWSKRGSKPIELEGCHVEVYWDLRSAKFSSSPEPIGDYYVALVSDGEVALMLGDHKKKAYKRTKARPALVDPILHHKKENVFAKKSFSTRARFDDKRHDNDVVVETSTTGPKDPEMWISVDGIIVIHVKNLQWKFRGNQTVMVNKQPVHVFWDVHNWLFQSHGTGHGLFIFKPGATEADSVKDGNGHGRDKRDGSRHFCTRSNSAKPNFCLFLYAWKLE